MIYVLGAMIALLMGGVCGWFIFMASAGPLKERKFLAWAWGIGATIILFFSLIKG